MLPFSEKSCELSLYTQHDCVYSKSTLQHNPFWIGKMILRKCFVVALLHCPSFSFIFKVGDPKLVIPDTCSICAKWNSHSMVSNSKVLSCWGQANSLEILPKLLTSPSMYLRLLLYSSCFHWNRNNLVKQKHCFSYLQFQSCIVYHELERKHLETGPSLPLFIIHPVHLHYIKTTPSLQTWAQKSVSK